MTFFVSFGLTNFLLFGPIAFLFLLLDGKIYFASLYPGSSNWILWLSPEF